MKFNHILCTLVPPGMNVLELSLFTHPHVIPNHQYAFFSFSAE